MPRLHMDASLAGLALTPWLLMGATLLLALAGRALAEFARDLRGGGDLRVGNTSFVGYPMARALLGR